MEACTANPTEQKITDELALRASLAGAMANVDEYRFLDYSKPNDKEDHRAHLVSQS